ncbi:MAG: helix-turn-helix domain-containing protein [Parasporobacterium sp.]|nr:helix-turn-helix domain-containing protein [Parasporobacterium sp.]
MIEKIKLLNNLIQCNTLDEIMVLSYKLLGNPAFVTDVGHSVLAYTDVTVDEIWEKNIKTDNLTMEFINGDIRLKSEQEAAFSSPVALRINKTYNGENQIKKGLTYNGKRLGLLIVIEKHRKFEPEAVEIVDLIGNVIARKLASNDDMLLRQENSKNTFFLSLLGGKKYSKDQMFIHSSILNIPADHRLYVCVIGNKKEADDHERDTSPLNEFLKKLPASYLSFIYENNVVLLLSSEDDVQDFRTEFRVLEEYLKKNHLFGGISNSFTNLNELKEYYLQGLRALSIGYKLGRTAALYPFSNLMLYDIFQNMPSDKLWHELHPNIIKLLRYDQENGTQLCRTMHAWLDNHKSQTKTSEVLYIHRNTVNYRIDQCSQVMGITLKNHDSLYPYYLSLCILEYLGRI